MDIQRKSFEESNNVNPDWSFKFDEELQQYVAVDFEMTNQVDEFNEHWDTFRAGWDAAKAQAVPKYNASIDAHQWAIDEIKTEINDGYDLCQDSYLLDVLVERGIEIGKIQAVPEGFVLVPVDQLNQWGHMANYAEQYGCPECFEARGYAHTLTCEINEYFAIGTQEPTND